MGHAVVWRALDGTILYLTREETWSRMPGDAWTGDLEDAEARAEELRGIALTPAPVDVREVVLR